MRQSAPLDAPEIARLIRVIWSDHNPDPAWIARVILESSHAMLIETAGDQVVGFVDSFATVSANGTLRWEVDLLGVHPDYRGRGIGQRLVSGAVEAGRQFGAEVTRALVQIDNEASLNTFRSCGFTADDPVSDLYISGAAVEGDAPVPTEAYLISVSTLTYSGVWVEGAASAEALRAAQAIRARYGWSVAGAVLEAGTTVPDEFEWVGRYRWITRGR